MRDVAWKYWGQYTKERPMRVESIAGIIGSALRVTNADGDYLDRIQERRFSALVAHARTASPYFRALYRDLPDAIGDWADLPPTKKSDLMANFDDWVTDPRLRLDRMHAEFLAKPELVGRKYLHQYRIFTTSGTTGTPAVIVHDPMSWKVFQLVTRLRSESQVLRHGGFSGGPSRGLKSAVLFATGGHYGGVGVATFVKNLHPIMSRRVRIISVLLPINEQVAELNEFQPTFLSGYPSALLAMAHEQEEGRLQIRPSIMLCAGEYLSEQQRVKLETTFHCHLLQGYAASEVPGLALECDHHNFHVNADWYLIEAVDSSYAPVPAGVTSDTCLVTNLSNFVQPIIRYDLGDRIRMQTNPCRCGSRLPSLEVEGRTNDLLTFQGDSGSMIDVVPLAICSVVEETPGVYRFQLVNPDPQHLRVRFDESPQTDRARVWERVHDRLVDFVAQQNAANILITLDEERPQPEKTGGKLKQVMR